MECVYEYMCMYRVSAYVFSIVLNMYDNFMHSTRVHTSIQSIDFSLIQENKRKIVKLNQRRDSVCMCDKWVSNDDIWDGQNYCVSNVLIITLEKSSMRYYNS